MTTQAHSKAVPASPLTYADYAALPDDIRGEVIDGAFQMSPAPEIDHQRASGVLFRRFGNWIEAHPEQGVVFISPIDVILEDTAQRVTVVQPDVVVVGPAKRSLISKRAIEGPPDLVVEVLSPSTKTHDRETKRALFARFRVPEYWIVDREQRTIEVLRLGKRDYDRVQLASAGDEISTPLLPGFVLRVADVLPPITDD